jgi:hypothetical protein
MYPDREVERHHVVVDGPGERRETISETRQGPAEFSLSPGMIAALVIMAFLAIGLTYYIVTNKNMNEEANRRAMLESAQTQPQPEAQQPVIIQPAPQPQAPVIIQQPGVASDSSNPLSDTTIQDAATKRLTDVSNLASVSVLVVGGKATLMGMVDSIESKIEAEKIVRSVQGVKSVENKIEVSNR